MSLDIGHRIRELRQRKGMTQSDLAIAIYSKSEYHSLVNRMEHRAGTLTLDMLNRYATALEVPMLELLRGHPATALLPEQLRVQHPRVSARYARPTKEATMTEMSERNDSVSGVRRGFYRHYKGAYYFVHGIATNHDDLEHLGPMVIYESSHGCAEEPQTMRFRPESEFNGKVQMPGGLCVKRFALVEEWPK